MRVAVHEYLNIAYALLRETRYPPISSAFMSIIQVLKSVFEVPSLSKMPKYMGGRHPGVGKEGRKQDTRSVDGGVGALDININIKYKYNIIICWASNYMF